MGRVTRPTDTGGLGFGLKWNMGWMHDSLEYVSHEPVHRKYHHHEMTFAMVYAYSENYVLPISHDEVVHGKQALVSKMPGDWWQRRPTSAPTWASCGPTLASNCCSWDRSSRRAEWSEKAGPEWWLLDEGYHSAGDHRGVQDLVRDLNAHYRDRPRCGSATPNRPASAGSRWTPPTTTSSRSCGTTRRGGRCSRCRTSPRGPARLPARGRRRRGRLGGGPQHRRGPLRRQRRGEPGPGQARGRARPAHPSPLATVWLAPTPQ